MKSIDECLSAVRRPSSGEFTQAASPPQLPVYSGWQTLPGIAYQSIVPWLPKRGRPAQSGYLSRSLRPTYGSLPVAHLHTLGVHTLQGATGTDIPARRTPRGRQEYRVDTDGICPYTCRHIPVPCRQISQGVLFWQEREHPCMDHAPPGRQNGHLLRHTQTAPPRILRLLPPPVVVPVVPPHITSLRIGTSGLNT